MLHSCFDKYIQIQYYHSHIKLKNGRQFILVVLYFCYPCCEYLLQSKKVTWLLFVFSSTLIWQESLHTFSIWGCGWRISIVSGHVHSHFLLLYMRAYIDIYVYVYIFLKVPLFLRLYINAYQCKVLIIGQIGRSAGRWRRRALVRKGSKRGGRFEPRMTCRNLLRAIYVMSKMYCVRC